MVENENAFGGLGFLSSVTVFGNLQLKTRNPKNPKKGTFLGGKRSNGFLEGWGVGGLSETD